MNKKGHFHIQLNWWQTILLAILMPWAYLQDEFGNITGSIIYFASIAFILYVVFKVLARLYSLVKRLRLDKE